MSVVASTVAGMTNALLTRPPTPGPTRASGGQESRLLTLSPSRVEDFLQCPLRFRFCALEGRAQPPTAAMARDALVRATLDALFALPAARRTRQEAARLVPRQWARAAGDDPDLAALLDRVAGHDPARLQRWFDDVVRLLDRWFTLEDPTRLEPVAREVTLAVARPGLAVRARLHRLDAAPDGRLRITVVTTRRGADTARALAELRGLGWVVWRSRGVLPTRLQLVQLGDGLVVTDEPDEAAMRGVERRLQAVAAAIERARAGDDFRPRPSSACFGCPHRAICPVLAAHEPGGGPSAAAA